MARFLQRRRQVYVAERTQAMWLESITIRTADLDRLSKGLSQLLEQLSGAAQAPGIDVYLRSPATSDVSLHLHHERRPIERSALGLRLVETLRTYGTVDHALWEPICLNDRSKRHD